MKAFLPKLAYRSEIGLSIGEREIALCRVAMTPFGPKEMARDRISYTNLDGLATAIETLTSRNLNSNDRERSRINVGLPALRIFFSTRPIQAVDRVTSPDVLLHEVLQSSSINVDDMAVDLLKIRPGVRPLASIVSCRKRYLTTVMTALEGCKLRINRVEPSPSALIRDAALKLRTPRKAGAFVRVFLGEGRALAVLLAGGNQPLLWRPFPLREGQEATAIASTISALELLGPYCGIEASITTILLHGRPDLTGLAEAVQAGTRADLRFQRADGPSLDEVDAAKALARAIPAPTEPFNLVRTLASPVSIRESLPWGQVLIQAAVLMAASWLLHVRQLEHRTETRAAVVEAARYSWATKLSTDKLRAEKKELQQKVDGVRSFLDSRVCWNAYSHELATLLSDDLSLSTFQGNFELEGGGRAAAKPKKSLVLRFVAPIPRTGAMPKEIDDFLFALRNDPLLKTNFPTIELADLKWTDAVGKKANAIFGVSCLPTKKGDTSKQAKAKPKTP